MKAFLEEYGVIIVATIVILALIAFAAIFGEQIVEAITNIIDDFFNKSGAATGAALATVKSFLF